MLARRSLGGSVALLLSLVGCSDSERSACPAPDGGVAGQGLAIVGRVLDAEEGVGVAEAVVTTPNGKSATSKSYGVFEMHVEADDKLAIIEREDYADTTRTLPKPGGSLDVLLKRVDQKLTFRGDKGTSVELPSGERLKIPANAMIDDDKQPVAGEIELEFAKADGRKRLEAAAVPGDGDARKQDGTSGKLSMEIAFSIHARELSSGKKLSVEAEKEVVIEIPVRSGKQLASSFSFDRKTAQWVEESAVRRSGSGADAVDVADIDHLSWWAVGTFFERTTCLRLCVEDSDGQPVNGAQVWLAGTTYAGVSSLFTDASGCGALDTLPNTEVELIAQSEGRSAAGARLAVGEVDASASDPAACQEGGTLRLSALPTASCALCDNPSAETDGGVAGGDDAGASFDAQVPATDGQVPELDGGIEPSPDGGPLLDASTGTDAGTGADEITQLTAGHQHACALYASGHVYCWGENTYGNSGQGTAAGNSTPAPVLLSSTVELSDAIAIASGAGAQHTCAVRSGGSVVCWGRNDQGQCGADAPSGQASRAYTVPGVSGATGVSVALNHSCAVLAGGGVVCWGDNTSGKLGSGATTPATSAAPLAMVEFNQAGAPTPIADAIAVAAGRNHTCVLHEGGTKVSCAGDDRMGGSGWVGALGRGGATITGGVDPVAAPVALPNGTVVKSLHAAGNGFYAGHTCVIPEQGRPICWGANTYVQIAPTSYGRPTPFEIDAYYTAPQLVALGRDFTCVSYINSELGPRVACQGNNGEGQFGDGTSNVSSDAIPNDVITASDGSTVLSGADVELMAAGTAFVCVKLTSGGVTCWGSNSGEVFGATGANRSYANLSALVPGLP